MDLQQVLVEFLLKETMITLVIKLFPTLVELLVLLKAIILKRILKDLHWYGLSGAQLGILEGRGPGDKKGTIRNFV